MRLGYMNGANLTPQDQQEALRTYVHRFTREHVPDWARQPRPDGTAYPVQFDSDREWLEHTQFPVTVTGRLRRGKDSSCLSSPTWPDNDKLRSASRPRYVPTLEDKVAENRPLAEALAGFGETLTLVIDMLSKGHGSADDCHKAAELSNTFLRLKRKAGL